MSGLSYIKCNSINNLQQAYLQIIDPLNHMDVLFHLNNSLSVIIDSMTHHGKLGQHHILRIYCVKNTMRCARSTRINRTQPLVLRSSQIAWKDNLINWGELLCCGECCHQSRKKDSLLWELKSRYFSDGWQIDEIICVRFLLGLLLKLDPTCSSCPSPWGLYSCHCTYHEINAYNG